MCQALRNKEYSLISRLEILIIQSFVKNKTKGPKQDRHNQLKSPMSEEGEHLVLLIITLFSNCRFQ
jgi:hypothetical protein